MHNLMLVMVTHQSSSYSCKCITGKGLKVQKVWNISSISTPLCAFVRGYI